MSVAAWGVGIGSAIGVRAAKRGSEFLSHTNRPSKALRKPTCPRPPAGDLYIRDGPVHPQMMRRSMKPGPDVALSTIERVRGLLEASKAPMSRNELLRRLGESGHATTRQRLNRVLSFFIGLGLAVDGSKGVQWTHSDSEDLRRAVATGRRL